MLARLIRTLRLVVLLLGGHRGVALENVAVRQQLAMYQRRRARPAVRCRDRWFWLGLRRVWPNWASALVVIRPATVVGWHRRGFAWYLDTPVAADRWAPPVDQDLRRLIRQMAAANPLWGTPRIHGELRKLGLDVSERTVSRLVPHRRRPPSQTWRAFLQNHVGSLVAVDFFAVTTITRRVLFVLVLLAHDRRRILHVNVTPHPTSAWTRQQLREAFPWSTPRYLLHDRDAVFDAAFSRTADALGMTEVRTAPRSPWQNPSVERVIGSIRRECLDHVIALSERHLQRLLRAYVAYYQHTRTHLALAKDTPEPRPVHTNEGRVVAIPEVGGLHHRYKRRAA